jgi:hypothetical protein
MKIQQVEDDLWIAMKFFGASTIAIHKFLPASGSDSGWRRRAPNSRGSEQRFSFRAGSETIPAIAIAMFGQLTLLQEHFQIGSNLQALVDAQEFQRQVQWKITQGEAGVVG